MRSSKADDVLARLEATGKLNGAEIEHYIGGGMPGPAMHNDQLRFFSRDGREVMEFAKSNFIRTEFNPCALDIYSLPAEPAVVQKFARLLRESRAYRDDFPEETPHEDADRIHLELGITEAGETASRSYPGGPPASFAPLETEVDALIARLRATGEYGLYDGKRKVEGAVRP